EFVNVKVNNFLKKNSVKLFHVFSNMKASIAERNIRTLKEKLTKIFYYTGSKRYIHILKDLANAYNTTKHSRTGLAPVNVNKKNESDVFFRLYKNESPFKA